MFWKRSKANAKIDRVVGENLELHLYSPIRDEDIFLRTDPRIIDWSEPMFVSLKQWADANQLGKWRRARILGDLEIAYKKMGFRGVLLKKLNQRALEVICS